MKALNKIQKWHSRNEINLAIIAWIFLTISIEIIGFCGSAGIDWLMVILGVLFFIMFGLLLGTIE